MPFGEIPKEVLGWIGQTIGASHGKDKGTYAKPATMDVTHGAVNKFLATNTPDHGIEPLALSSSS